MDILYRDKFCTVAQKDIGIVCEDTGTNSLPALVREACGGEAYPVHRIDKVAGGAVLLGNSPQYAEKLRALGFDKEYLFITVGSLPEKSGVLSDYMFHDTQKNKSYVVKRMRRGVREASLEYTVLSEKEGYALVKAKMITGRTHQLRVHCAYVGCPILGDPQYGTPPSRAFSEEAGLFTQQLCAYSLEFQHPITGKKMHLLSRMDTKHLK